MRTTQQMSITLPNEMADVVKSKVRAGEYASESEVIRDGLRALMARDRVIEAWLRETAVPAARALKDDPPGHSRPTRSANSSRSAAKPRGKPRVSYAVVFSPKRLNNSKASKTT